MAYKYRNTIAGGAEELIDGLENIELFLDDRDEWNFHDSEITSIHMDFKENSVTVTVKPDGYNSERADKLFKEELPLLDFKFIDVCEIKMNTSLPYYIDKIEISKYNGFLECWFNGYGIRVTSRRLCVAKP